MNVSRGVVGVALIVVVAGCAGRREASIETPPDASATQFQELNASRLAEMANARQRITNAFLRKDYTTAIAIADVEIAKSTGDLYQGWRALCYGMRGSARNRLGQFHQARSDLTRAIALNP